MAAIRPSHSRLRSASDPFTDPAVVHRRPPPVPPKNTPKHRRMPAPVPKSAPPTREAHADIREAVRDTVTVHGATDYNPRNRVARSQTSAIPPVTVRPVQHRSHSQDSGNRHDKSKAAAKTQPKKGSQHADVIDRLDFTGVGPMFHHDGPFDACAPSRNRQRNKAPMFAWSARPEDRPTGDSAYPSAHAYAAFSNTNYVDPPKKKVDAIAEAWGIHEPEPYEEFFAGGGTGKADTPSSSIYNGRDSHNSQSSRNGNGAGRARDARDVYREYLEGGQPGNGDARPRGATRRTLVPPPQPIFVPDPSEITDLPGHSPPLSAQGAPKRSKSLMHRIRKMRDAPNVPVSSDYDQPPRSPTSPTDPTARPTHRSQNSFLGRFGGGSRNPQAGSDKSEPFVYIEAHTRNNKDLPPPPRSAEGTPPDVPEVGYFDGQNNSGAGSSPGLGRKTSLMKKVGRVVGRSRQ